MEQNYAAALASLVSMFLLTFFVLALTFFILKKVKQYRYRRKLEKIDYSSYSVFATDKGLPIIFQSNKNKNEFIYL